jgi:hypothetical protein
MSLSPENAKWVADAIETAERTQKVHDFSVALATIITLKNDPNLDIGKEAETLIKNYTEVIGYVSYHWLRLISPQKNQ